MKRLLITTMAATLTLATMAAIAPSADADASSTPATKITTSGFAAVVIGADGSPYGTGPLTGGDSLHTLTPLPGLPGGVRATAAATGDRHAVILGSDGVAYGIGDNDHGQLTGFEPSIKPELSPLGGLPTGVRATAVSASGDHSLVLGSNGIAYGTGDNTDSELTGLSTLDKPVLTYLSGLPSGVQAVGIDAGPNHSLVLGSNGVAYGAGRNSSYPLTGADQTTKANLVPLLGLPGGVQGTAVAAGFDFSLLLGSNGVVYGAGSNSISQLTGPSPAAKTGLTPLAGLPGGVRATAIAAGDYHSLVLGSNGTAYGSGYNEYGQLTGLNFGPKDSLSPLTGMPAGTDVTGIAAGGFDSLLLGSDNVVYGIGYNGGGQLTGPSGQSVTTPRPLSGQVLVATTAPSFGPVAQVGATVSASTGAWQPTPTAYAYQWSLDGTPLPGAVNITHPVTAAEVGRSLTVTVTATRAGQVTGTSTSAGQRVASGAALTWTAKKKPKIAGSAKVGKRLKVRGSTRAAWSPYATRISYRWYRGAKPIAGATKPTYKLKRADKRHKIRVRVYGQLTGYDTGVCVTKPTPRVRG